MVTTPCQIYVLFKIIDLNLTNSLLLNIYKEDGKDMLEFSSDIFSIYKGESFLEPFVEIDVVQLADDNLLDYDLDILYLEVNKLIWNIRYQECNVNVKNYSLFDCFFIEPDTMVFEYRKNKR